MEKEYKGYKLYYNENRNSWFSIAKDSGENISLTQAKEFVDKMVKRNFTPVDVYYGYDLTPAKITSITEAGDAWISYMYGTAKQRSKISGYDQKSLIEVSAENVEKGLALKEKKRQLKELENEIEEIERSFKRVDIENLIKQV